MLMPRSCAISCVVGCLALFACKGKQNTHAAGDTDSPQSQNVASSPMAKPGLLSRDQPITSESNISVSAPTQSGTDNMATSTLASADAASQNSGLRAGAAPGTREGIDPPTTAVLEGLSSALTSSQSVSAADLQRLRAEVDGVARSLKEGTGADPVEAKELSEALQAILTTISSASETSRSTSSTRSLQAAHESLETLRARIEQIQAQ